MANALEHVAWEECLLEPRPDRAMAAYARRRQGIPNPTVGYFAASPWLARAVIDMHPEYGLLMHLDQNTADLVALVVSQENSCRFCYAAVRTLLWAQGMSQARIERLEQQLARDDLPARTAAAIAFARSQSRLGPAHAREAREQLRRAGFSDEEMKEIAFVVANTDFLNRAFTIPAIPTRSVEHMSEQLYMRLLRPLIGRIIRSRHARGNATPPADVPAYPYAGLVRAYAGYPMASILGRTLDEMWSAPHLTRRCKLLMLAVVARGLGCEACAVELRGLLQAEGLGEAAIDQILAHLDSPELESVERLLLHFTRATIWYEPAPLQRRARALRDQLPGPAFLEAIGVASLANGVCRMGAMVMDQA
jgi:AhpD family alkylhydroperoxidase